MTSASVKLEPESPPAGVDRGRDGGATETSQEGGGGGGTITDLQGRGRAVGRGH